MGQINLKLILLLASVFFAGVFIRGEFTRRLFPVTIVPQIVLQKTVQIGNRQSILADSLLRVSLQWENQDKLNAFEIEKKNKIIEYQKQFIAFSDSTNQMLNKSIGALNTQLSECRQLATEANKRQKGKKIWSILIGSGIGFGLGAILGIIAAK